MYFHRVECSPDSESNSKALIGVKVSPCFVLSRNFIIPRRKCRGKKKGNKKGGGVVMLLLLYCNLASLLENLEPTKAENRLLRITIEKLHDVCACIQGVVQLRTRYRILFVES